MTEMPEQTPTPAGTSPSQPALDLADAQRIAKVKDEVLTKYAKWRPMRQPHEGKWFENAAMLRNQQHAVYSDIDASLIVPERPSYAVTVDINKILPKHRARMAKFFKNRPKPMVIPASTEYRDLMDARATERALKYQWERLRLESAYRDARQWASVGSKSYWWIGYDDTVMGRVKTRDPLTGQERVEEAILGDVIVEVGNVWEVLVADPAIARIGQQPEIMRVRSMPRGEAERRFPQLRVDTELAAGDTKDLKQAEDSIAGLVAGYQGSATTAQREDDLLLRELFTAPCGSYPRGRKITMCGDTVVRYTEELPFEFWDSPTNPYPCVEFSDTGNVGQFWNTTFIEQLTPLQRLFNRLLELLVENVEAVSRPKVVFYKQHNLPDGAYTSAAGEILEPTHVPNLPPPFILQPASVSGDIWNLINLVERQFDNVSQIHTASEGGGGGQESGYQTNLLQEATDAVHAPDIRGDELAIEDAAWKIRRIMKLTWDVPRLLSMGGEGTIAEVLEFSNRQINDASEVRIQIGSMLPDLKAAKSQVALEYFKAGLLGDPNDPMVKRKALNMVDAVGYDTIHPEDRVDEDEVSRENERLLRGEGLDPAKFYHNHAVHASKHEARMKTPEFELLPDQAKLSFIAHLITHYDFLNPPLALGLRSQYGLQTLPVSTPPPAPAPPGAAPAPPGAPPPSGTPAPPAPQPVA